jgi:hypothetical protein
MAKAGWNTLLHIGDQVTLGTAVTATNVLGLSNDIHMGPTAPEIVTPGLVRDGTSVRQKRYLQPGKISPVYTGAQTPFTASALQWLLANLTSNVTDEAAGTNVACAPYTSATPVVFYTLLKYMEATGGGTEVEDCIINKIGIDCPADAMATLSFDFMGTEERLETADAGASVPITGVGILTKNATVTWDGDACNQIAMSFEFTNNAIFDHQQAQLPVGIVLGELGLSGSLTVEWDEALANAIDTDIRTGYDVVNANEWDLSVTWGSTGASGYVNFVCAVYVSGQPTQSETDGYQTLTIPWTMANGTVTPIFTTAAAVPFLKAS